MKLTKKITSMLLSLSIFILPNSSKAKTEDYSSEKVVSLSKKSKNVKKKHTKITKVSYSYSQEDDDYYSQGIYGDHLEPNKDIYKYAVGLLGTKYTFGGTSIDGIDCSSFVQHVFKLAGFNLPRTAREQARYGYFIRKENLKPGDLLFFATYASFPSHVGIYIGDGKMIHASSRGGRVEITNINQDFYIKRFLFAKRIPAKWKTESIDSIEQYINSNEKSRKKSIENDPIAKIIQEKSKSKKKVEDG